MLGKIFIENLMRISGWYEGKGMLSGKNEKNVQKIDINLRSTTLSPLQAFLLLGSFCEEIIL